MAFKPTVKVKAFRPKTKSSPQQDEPTVMADDLSKKNKRKLKDQNRIRILKEVQKGGVCVEIGVWRGNFSKLILETANPLHLALIDPWKHFGDDEKSDAFAGQTEDERFEDIYKDVCKKYANEIASGRVSIMRELSKTAIAQFEDETIDFAYIDGDHSYEGVTRDLNDIFPKMKTDGIMAFDDYHRFGWWGDGVLRAIHEFIGKHPAECRVMMVEGAQIALTKLGPLPDPEA